MNLKKKNPYASEFFQEKIILYNNLILVKYVVWIGLFLLLQYIFVKL